jgi:putative restriction endonuclease
MNYKTLYGKELSNPSTNFFIFETKGSGVKHDDVEYDNEAATEALQDIQNENYHVDDQKSEAPRRSKQSVFSNKVKNNYGNTCAMCGIKTKVLLIGSHIIPWATRKDIRLDPSNSYF